MFRKVLYSYKAKHSDEITICKDELIEVYSEGKSTNYGLLHAKVNKKK